VLTIKVASTFLFLVLVIAALAWLVPYSGSNEVEVHPSVYYEY
jgi:hypothetical protein